MYRRLSSASPTLVLEAMIKSPLGKMSICVEALFCSLYKGFADLTSLKWICVEALFSISTSLKASLRPKRGDNEHNELI
jgi:hypothetical protein